jgi:hypothetical protein
MGNSRWRLETALNYVAKNVQELGREADVEVLVADWGSDVPLREVLQLSPAAARIVSFLLIPGELARVLQKDSPFPEVLALNAVARRVNGQYIGRIDQDTLVGQRFLRMFFEMHGNYEQSDVPLDSAFMFSRRRRVPYRFTILCPSLWQMERFIRWFHRTLGIEHEAKLFFHAAVGIMLMHRRLWEECGGYDERLLYMNHMEVDMAYRLAKRYKLMDLGQLTGHDFYHLEHHHPLRGRKVARRWNPSEVRFDDDKVLHPNSEKWGLIQYPLEALPYPRDPSKVEAATFGQPRLGFPVFILLVLFSGTQIVWDVAIKRLKREYALWNHRARVAWNTVREQPLVSWPRVLMSLWAQRQSRQRRWRHN